MTDFFIYSIGGNAVANELPVWTRALGVDLRQAARDLGDGEIRYLVDAYYQMQEYRKRAYNQKRAADGEPSEVVGLVYGALDGIERQIKSALDTWTDHDHMGKWSKGHYGIGPVIAAGLSAHIDITRARTAGAIWRFAGLDPTVEWRKGEKRPWNARLKVLAWKTADSFVKFSNQPKCFYGRLYRERKAYELEQDATGAHVEAARQTLEAKNIRDPDTRRVYESGCLPAGRLDLRARRYAVKLFLAHWFEEAYRNHHGSEPPLPYPIAQLGHTHRIEAPV